MPRPRYKLELQGPAVALATFTSALDLSAGTVTVTGTTLDWVAEGNQRVHDQFLGSANDLETLRVFMVNRVATLQGAGVSGRMTLHQCSHEDAVVHSCRADPASSYQEVVV